MHLLLRRAFGFRLCLCVPPLHVSNVRCIVLQSPAPGQYKDITDLERGIDFVASIVAALCTFLQAWPLFSTLVVTTASAAATEHGTSHLSLCRQAGGD